MNQKQRRKLKLNQKLKIDPLAIKTVVPATVITITTAEVHVDVRIRRILNRPMRRQKQRIITTLNQL
jgi:hypothetical protein